MGNRGARNQPAAGLPSYGGNYDPYYTGMDYYGGAYDPYGYGSKYFDAHFLCTLKQLLILF